MMDSSFFSKLFKNIGNRQGVNRQTINTSNYQYLIDKPAWLSLSKPEQYREAVCSNPVLNGCIAILAKAASNGKKVLVDLNGNEIPWTSNKTGVKQARKLFIDNPNPLQSAFEFNYERMFMFFTYGNSYIYCNNPFDAIDTDITNVQTMFNLPSEHVVVRQTGKMYDQTDVKGIIEKYAVTCYNPIKEIDPKNIIHFNDINISDVGISVIGTSRLQNLKYAITNTQLAFEAMNVILKSRGMQGIIKSNNKDGQGTQVPLLPTVKKEIEDKFKEGYGIQENQKQFLIVNADIDFIKTIMSAEELGIYNEFANNAMIITNNLGVPPELYKTHTEGATFENQIQAVRRLYQDTVIPHVENDDKYFTSRLKLRDFGFELTTKWDHIAALAENEREKATTLSQNVNSSEKLYNSNLITLNEYRSMLGLSIIENGNMYKRDLSLEKVTLAEKIGVVGTQSLQAILADSNMSEEQKKWALIYLFGLDDIQAANLTKGSKSKQA